MVDRCVPQLSSDTADGENLRATALSDGARVERCASATEHKKGKRSTEYHSWHAMLNRCYLVTHRSYPAYGGSGIRVTEEWRGKGGFDRFLAYMGTKPSPIHTVDRFPNKSGHYEPGNVRWATPKEQANNRRDNTTEDARLARAERMGKVRSAWVFTVGNRTLPLRDWAKEAGISVTLLCQRLKAGWPLERAISPKKKKHGERRKPRRAA